MFEKIRIIMCYTLPRWTSEAFEKNIASLDSK